MYWHAYKIRTVRTRMFTHSGPRRGEVFVDSFFAQQVARIEHGLQEPVVRVGNLDSVRTFADVRDTVRAYWLLALKCQPGEVYNIGGDITMTIREMLDLLLGMTTFEGKIEVRQDPALIRPADVTLQIPSSDKFKAATGWTPEIPYRQTLLDMLNYWRRNLSATCLNDLDVVILAGGFGTRLRTVVADRPKVLAPINGVPFSPAISGLAARLWRASRRPFAWLSRGHGSRFRRI